MVEVGSVKMVLNMSEDTFTIFSKMYDNSTYVLHKDLVEWCIDHQMLLWMLFLLAPVVVTLLLPTIMLALVYVSALYLKAYRYYYKINGYTFTPKCWEGARSLLAHLWDAQARFWYGYEIEGLENIPSEGPALIVFYHGSMPVDWYYLLSKCIMYKNRMISAVGDRFLFKVPAFDALIDCFQVYPGTIDTCADILRKGNLLAIAPGGVREALFADESYPLIWGNRIGFAKVAMEAKVPIIPVFTKNIREAFFTLNIGKDWLRGIYEKTRIPLVPIYGGFPVKLKTIVGKAVPYDPDITPEEMAKMVSARMQALISRHQQIPGSISRGVMERIQYFFKRKLS